MSQVASFELSGYIFPGLISEFNSRWHKATRTHVQQYEYFVSFEIDISSIWTRWHLFNFNSIHNLNISIKTHLVFLFTKPFNLNFSLFLYRKGSFWHKQMYIWQVNIKQIYSCSCYCVTGTRVPPIPRVLELGSCTRMSCWDDRPTECTYVPDMPPNALTDWVKSYETVPSLGSGLTAMDLLLTNSRHENNYFIQKHLIDFLICVSQLWIIGSKIFSLQWLFPNILFPCELCRNPFISMWNMQKLFSAGKIVVNDQRYHYPSRLSRMGKRSPVNNDIKVNCSFPLWWWRRPIGGYSDILAGSGTPGDTAKDTARGKTNFSAKFWSDILEHQMEMKLCDKKEATRSISHITGDLRI